MNKKNGANVLERSSLLSGKLSKNQRRPGANSSLPTAVLHVDDDSNDTVLLQAAVLKAGAHFNLMNVADGEQAMAYLSGLGQYADRSRFPIPSLILLDLKMPRLTGFEILKWIRMHPALGDLPVLVLSGSQLQEDIR